VCKWANLQQCNLARTTTDRRMPPTAIEENSLIGGRYIKITCASRNLSTLSADEAIHSGRSFRCKASTPGSRLLLLRRRAKARHPQHGRRRARWQRSYPHGGRAAQAVQRRSQQPDVSAPLQRPRRCAIDRSQHVCNCRSLVFVLSTCAAATNLVRHSRSLWSPQRLVCTTILTS